jgi:hypothetical protein
VLITGKVDEDTERFLTTNNPTSLKERESVLSQTSAGQRPLRLATYTGFTGHSAWITETFSDDHFDSIACISVSYFYGWILALRIEQQSIAAGYYP